MLTSAPERRRPTIRALIVLAACALPLLGARPAIAATTSFDPVGAEQPFTVPDGVTSIDVVAVGGYGGPGGAGGVGGRPGRATGTIAVTPGQVLYVEVGGNGGDGGSPLESGQGGFNGGAQGGLVSGSNRGGGGGGASDVRTIPAGSGGPSLASRLVVAGGGGGGASGTGIDGGDAGGLDGAAGGYTLTCDPNILHGAGGGGTQSAGGAAGDGVGAKAGALGVGGRGSTGGGGGGGGLFGGGGASTCGGGGGGSSGFAATVTGTSTATKTDATGPSVVLNYTPRAPGTPAVTAISPASGANANGIRVTGTADPASTVRLYPNALCGGTPIATADAATFASPGIAVDVADNSTTTFFAAASNSIGPSGCSSASVTYVEDSAPPDTSIDSAPDATTSSRPLFTFHASEPGATFECSIDSGTPAFAPCSGPGGRHTPAVPIAAGTYTFRVRATDRAGNSDPSPATHEFTIAPAPQTASATETADGTITVPTTVRCPASSGGGCRVTITINPTGSTSRASAATLATFRLKLKAGQRLRPSIRLPPSLRRKLRGRAALKLAVTITVRPSTGPRTITSLLLNVRRHR